MYRSAVRPRIDGLDEARPNRVLLNVMPFFGIDFAGSQIPIEIIRLPGGRIDGKRRRDLSRADAFPHLHPIGHTARTDFRPRKEMYVIRH